jgi:hypothetical protein
MFTSYDTEIHYRVYKGPPLGPTLKQMSLVHILMPCFLKIISKLSSHPRLRFRLVSFLQVSALKFCIRFSSVDW